MNDETTTEIARRPGPGRAVARAVARFYPFAPYRGRLPWLNGDIGEIPSGEIVQTREALRIRVEPDGMYHDIYFWGDYEPLGTKIYRRLVRSGDVVFDIGANFGWFTALFARWVSPAGIVHSFEPVPFIHALSTETIDLNGVESGVVLNRFGLGQEERAIPLFTFRGLPHGHATTTDLGRDDAVEHECRIRRLDDYCEEMDIDAIHFMKVDVEGFERDVFLGGTGVLSATDAPIIAFELNRECLAHRKVAADDVIETIRQLGYTDFFMFSLRDGIGRLDVAEVGDRADCLAAKPHHLERMRLALRTGRLLR